MSCTHAEYISIQEENANVVSKNLEGMSSLKDLRVY
jgi:hypothetical protein